MPLLVFIYLLNSGKKMELTTPENCELLRVLLADLCRQLRDIEAQQQMKEGLLGMDNTDEGFKANGQQVRALNAAIGLLEQLLEALGCDCGNCKNADSGGAPNQSYPTGTASPSP